MLSSIPLYQYGQTRLCSTTSLASRSQLASFYLHNPSLHTLLRLYSPWEGDVSLASISAATTAWDTRRNTQRLHRNGSEYDVPLTPELTTLFADLQMMPTLPPDSPSSDYIVVLGAYLPGMRRRHEYVSALTKAGYLNSATPVLTLTSARQADSSELTLFPSISSPADETETTLARRLICELLSSPSSSRRIHRILSTGKSDSTTADTFLLLRRYLTNSTSPSAPINLLIVTTALYAPYQHIQCIAAFAEQPYVTQIATIGCPTALASHDKPVPRHLTLTAYLQEVRSIINSLPAL